MNRKKIVWLIAALLLVLALALYLWWPVIFQRGNPIPYLLAMSQLSEKRPYVEVEFDPPVGMYRVYITKRGDCPELISMIEKGSHTTFVEQAGSSLIFRTKPISGDWWFMDGLDSITVSTEIYWRYFTVWQVPVRVQVIS